ncbi:aminotransferase class I/II-fold pyridoxal phosphate-dependent enzyme [Stutzerimonas zhaodongensis]|jgi:DNA-binding transcriptional MocR family regulator|uniref:aminotransferase class I/II-fold pyridoxal phosphate-dependent enzyme n=1 Tax=Stutzerimonas zhaodongensis TaxID=1176257 RepID=UPI001F4F0F02|nr:aminotransferase class I/II-fold pyridoxal phosphate-dependent enzyme [Stutzerimonas zhaodongensis]UNG16806.1 aminotransferase class I/II-fold pyridoxal phosphate-dependent enzyme [Stutzerimonas zhaodongensis]
MNTIASGSTAVEIAESIEQQIRSGFYRDGALLPAVRSLAQQLQVSPNTVAAAYKLLRDAALIVTDGRRGTRVAGEMPMAENRTTIPEGLRDMASGNIDGATLPAIDAGWLTESQSGYDVQSNDPQLLDVAGRWLADQRIPCQQLGIYSGALDAVERALRLRCRPGNKVIVEDPCWPPALALLASLRLKAVPVPVDEEGALAPSAEVLRSAAAVILTPRAHNPTGFCISERRWREWLDKLADAPDTLLILDDHWGPLSAAKPLSFTREPLNWLYVVSVSKFLGPDLRVSVVTGSSSVLKSMHQQQTLGPRWVSLLLQRLAGHLWQKMLDSSRLSAVGAEYLGRRSALIQGLRDLGVAVPTQGEGLHVWLPVSDETSVVQTLASLGWAIQAGSPFRLESPAAVRISIGNLNPISVPALARDVAHALKQRRRTVN